MKHRLLAKVLCGALAFSMIFSQASVSYAAVSNETASGEEVNDEGTKSTDVEETGQTSDESTVQVTGETIVPVTEDEAVLGSDETATEGINEDVETPQEDNESPIESDSFLLEEIPAVSTEAATDESMETEDLYTIPDLDFPEGFEGFVDDAPATSDDGSDAPNDATSFRLLKTSNNNVYVDITGTYYTLPADTILNQLNRIRLEAYNEGLTDRYVPLKWSATIEASARKRAMEAGLTIAHETLSNDEIYSYMGYGSEFWGFAEDLAWNNNHNASGITYGINQFYGEKAEYLKALKGQSHGITGHYTSIINPDYEYVGVGGCQMSGTPHGWFTVALQLGGNPQGTIDETKDSSTGKITNTLKIRSSYITSTSLSGPTSINKEETGEYSLTGKLSVGNGYGSSSADYSIPAGEDRDVIWTSSDEDIATIENGSVTGIQGGKATITASLGSITASKEITVKVPFDAINLSCPEIAGGCLNDGTFEVIRDDVKKGTLILDYLPEDATDTRSATWKSSNPKVATVDSNGNFTLLKAGTTTITATAKTTNPEKPTITASFTLKVKVPITGIKLSKESAVLSYTTAKAPTLKLTTSILPADAEGSVDVIFTSSDPNVATVSENGLVTAVSGGTTTITASADSFSPKCEITVSAPVKGLAVSDTQKKLFTTQDSSDLTVSLTPLYTSDKDLIFTSTDPEVFTVSGVDGVTSEEVTVTAVNGVATVTLHRMAESNGEATLNVTTANGKFKKAVKVLIAKPTTDFTVHRDENDTDLSGSEFEIPVGSVETYVCDVVPADTYDSTITWSSSNTAVATVKSLSPTSATVSYVGKGTAVITCINDNAPSPIEKSFTVSPVIRASDISFNRSTLDLYEGETYTLSPQVLPEGIDADVVLTSSQPSVATVDANGKITAVSEGKATIIATSVGLAPASCVVTVSASEVLDGDTPYEGETTDGIWIASQSFDSSQEYTGSKITQPELRVYYSRKLLKEKTDYTLAYKNNISAASADSRYAPQMTVTLKGQFQGKKTYYFEITPADISDSNLVTENGEINLVYTGKTQKPLPELFFADKKLANKKDFTCRYTGSDSMYINESLGSLPEITVEGKGNFKGTRRVRFRIVGKNQSLSKASVTVGPSTPGDKKIYYRGSLSASDLAVTVKLGGEIVDPSYYEIVSLPDKVGKGTVKIAATAEGENHSIFGYKTVSITTVADRSMKAVVIAGFSPSMIFDPYQAATGGLSQEMLLNWQGEPLTEGTDYKVTYSANTKVGTAKVTLTGLGRYSGSLSKSFKITSRTDALTIDYADEISFTKGGVTPDVTVTYAKETSSELTLNNKTDYSISILNRSNQKPGTMKFQIVGKGNYKGYKSEVYEVTVTNGDLKNTNMVLTDKAYVAKGNGWKSAVKITDTNGKALQAGKDYDKNLLYSYEGMTATSVPEAGSVVYVTAVGRGDYAGSSITRAYRVFRTNVNKLTFVVDPMTYTGRSLEPAEGVQIHAYANAKDAKAGINEIAPEDNYTVVGYSSNINSGTGKITVKGLGNFGSTKVLNFKISKKTY